MYVYVIALCLKLYYLTVPLMQILGYFGIFLFHYLRRQDLKIKGQKLLFKIEVYRNIEDANSEFLITLD